MSAVIDYSPDRPNLKPSEWAARWHVSLDAYSGHIWTIFPPTPVADDVDFQELLNHCVQVLDRIAPLMNEPDWLTEAANRWAKKKSKEPTRFDVDMLFGSTFRDLMQAISRCLNKGATHKGIVHTTKFGFDGNGVRVLDIGEYLLSPSGSGTVLYALGEINSLKPKNPLRDLIPEPDLFRLDGGETLALVLGPCVQNTHHPRTWYRTKDVENLTASFRSRQRLEERKKEQAKKEQEQEKARKFAESDVGKLARHLAELERLKAEGNDPTDTDDGIVRVQKPIKERLTDEDKARAEARAARQWEAVTKSMQEQEAKRLAAIKRRQEREKTGT